MVFAETLRHAAWSDLWELPAEKGTLELRVGAAETMPADKQSATEKASSMLAFMRTHTGERSYACDVPGCGYTAAQSGALMSHMRIHTGERPYACDVPGCGYTAAENGMIKRHMRTHTGERPYACDFPGCGYSAAKSGGLKRHALIH